MTTPFSHLVPHHLSLFHHPCTLSPCWPLATNASVLKHLSYKPSLIPSVPLGLLSTSPSSPFTSACIYYLHISATSLSPSWTRPKPCQASKVPTSTHFLPALFRAKHIRVTWGTTKTTPQNTTLIQTPTSRNACHHAAIECSSRRTTPAVLICSSAQGAPILPDITRAVITTEAEAKSVSAGTSCSTLCRSAREP